MEVYNRDDGKLPTLQ